jgi:O-antigen/teichoic acid export membrane protein
MLSETAPIATRPVPPDGAVLGDDPHRLMVIGTLTFGLAVLVTRVSSMVLVLVMSRLITPTDLGLVSYILAVYTVANVVCDVGLSASLPRFVSRARRPDQLIAHALVLRIAVSMAAGLVIWTTDQTWQLFRGAGAQIGFLVACSAFTAAVSVLDASLRFIPSALTRAVVGIGWIIGAVVLVDLGLPVWGPVLAYGLAMIVAGLPTFWISLRRHTHGFQRAVFRDLVTVGTRVVTVLALTSITSQAGVVMLAYLRGDEAAAMYRVASIVAAPPLLLAAAIGDPLTNLVARLDASDDPRSAHVLLRPILTLLLATAGIMLPLGLLVGADVLAIFGRGEYSRGSGLLYLLIGANALGMLGTVAIGVLYALGELRVLVRATGLVALTALAGTYLLLAPLGELSAGVAQVGANIVLVLLLGTWFRRYLRGSVDRSALYRALGLVGAAFALALAFTDAPIVARLAMALLIVAAYVWLLLPLIRPAYMATQRQEPA